MTVIRSARRMEALAKRLERRKRRVGVVPTMGCLHEGHLSLIRAARSQNDVVIVTLFVNPLQFGPGEDFARYPRPFARDRALAKAAGTDILFAPTQRELYPRGFQTAVDLGALARRWEGASRAGHFRGVATVVTILFRLTRPTMAYVGQKDYQQALIIQRLARDLRLGLSVRILPTVREPDGLAMSSRNASLTPTQRLQAATLFLALGEARERIRGGERSGAALIEGMRRRIGETEARIDYAAIVDAATLEPVWRLRGRVALLVAARLGRTRLIDNLLVDVS